MNWNQIYIKRACGRGLLFSFLYHKSVCLEVCLFSCLWSNENWLKTWNLVQTFFWIFYCFNEGSSSLKTVTSHEFPDISSISYFVFYRLFSEIKFHRVLNLNPDSLSIISQVTKNECKRNFFYLKGILKIILKIFFYFWCLCKVLN